MTRRAAGLLALLGALTAVRLWWCGRFELSPDEAYYRLWSQRLDWAYYSKGPGVALAIRLGTALLGDTERGVRWLSPLLALGTTLVLWWLVRDALSRRTATATAIALQCVPLFGVGSLLMTVDPLSVFFWVLALACAWRALTAGGAGWWAACGAASGLGFACKYTNSLVLAGIALAIASRREWRGALRDRRGLLLVAGFLPFVLPPIAWNARHGWVTATHLFERGGLARTGSWLQPHETLEFLGVHFGTWSPIVFGLVLATLPAIVRRARDEAGVRLLLLASLPILAMYCVLALHEAGEANWTGPGLLGLLPLAADEVLRRADASRAGSLPGTAIAWRATAVAGLALGALLTLSISNVDLLRRAGVPIGPRQDPSARLRGWRETAARVQAERSRLGLQRAPLVANHYGLASELAFYGARDASASGPPPVEVVPTKRPRNAFWFWPSALRSEPPPDVALFVTDRAAPPPDDFAARCEPVAELPIEGGGGTLRTIRLHACRGLHPAPR